ncbi:hypothetical protein K9M59_04575 [Candidatus Gracilibacteria bacterium]|nr:hypothetical protein [Candidatus Gracilibacteria bacterium]MCF7819829.1 hypothetical protein [Candidatus Gracilibacteria bacterium]
MSSEGMASENIFPQEEGKVEPWLEEFLHKNGYGHMSPKAAKACRSQMLQMATYQELGCSKKDLANAAEVFGGILRKIVDAHQDEKITPQQAAMIFNSLLKGHAQETLYAALNGSGEKLKKIFGLELKAYEEMLARAGVPPQNWPLVIEKLMPEMTENVEKIIQDLLNEECTVDDILWCASSDRKKDVVETAKEMAEKVFPIINQKKTT